LNSKINIVKFIGKGNQGSVFLGEYKETSEKIAIKKILCHSKENLLKLIDEIIMVSSVSNKNILSYKEHYVIKNDEEDSTFEVYMVMDFCEWSLDNILKEKIEKKSPFSENVKNFI
jgi:serine/threonine protein kinase